MNNIVKFPEVDILNEIAKKGVERAETHFRVRRLEEGDTFIVESVLLNTETGTSFAVIKIDGYGFLDCPLGQILKACPFEEIKNHKFIVKGFRGMKFKDGVVLLPIIEKY